MFERRNEALISRRRFLIRVMKGILLGLLIDGTTVLFGALGYHEIEGMGWLTGFVNAVMVITGNGLVFPVRTQAGKIFSMFDALVGVLVFISVAGVLLAPIFHRILHTFHLEVRDATN